MSSELGKRLIYGPLMSGLAFACIWLDFRSGRPFCTGLLIVVGISLGCREYDRLLRHLPAQVDGLLLFVWCLILAGLPLVMLLPPVVDALADTPLADPLAMMALVVGLATVSTIAHHMFCRSVDDFFRDVGATLLGILYLGVLPFFITLLICWDGTGSRGLFLFLTMVATCKLGDVFAFSCGKLFGRHKLVPRISPGKTWEGFVGALGGSVLAAWLCVIILRACGQPELFRHTWAPILWGLVIGTVGVFGDLMESVIKRSCDVKDSGATIPGFGGFLDVFDAVIPAGLAAVLLSLYL